MIRIAGVNIPDEKCIDVSLTYIYGIGISTSKKILEGLGIDPTTRTKDISEKDANKLREVIEKEFKVEGELRHEKNMNVRRLKEVGCYRGTRHHRGLPVRGQRTKTNNRTVRGNKRVTMGSGRAAAASKT
ncbi:MAG: 30S ribosomal protein S13 [Candidatus Moraniibacteriota bacterium]|nr:MAG: 30S ribosomal protein S13 [Candidatus Moranbacteria bacterium]